MQTDRGVTPATLLPPTPDTNVQVRQRVAVPAAPPRWLRPVAFWLALVAAVLLSIWTSNPVVRLAMLAVAIGGLVAVGVELLGHWMCERVDSSRAAKLFFDIDGEAIWLPNAKVGDEAVKKLFGHPQLIGRGRGRLRDTILWMHAPASNFHQELMERTDTYDHLKQATARLVKRSADELRQIAGRHIDKAVACERDAPSAWRIVGLRHVVRPIAINCLFEVIFGKPPSTEALAALVASNDDLVLTVEARVVRNMGPRYAALGHLREALEAEGGLPAVFGHDSALTMEERAKYLLGVWMHSGVAQVYRLAMKAMLATLRNPRVLNVLRSDLREGGRYIEAVILEAARLYPGFLLTDRRALSDIQVEGAPMVERGTTVYFHFWNYHRIGFDRAEEFIPERWNEELKQTSNYMPFGSGKRRCPAERMSLVLAEEIAANLLTSLEFHVASSRGIVHAMLPRFASADTCCLVSRPSLGPVRLWAIRCGLNVSLALGNIRTSLVHRRTIPGQDAECERELAATRSALDDAPAVCPFGYTSQSLARSVP